MDYNKIIGHEKQIDALKNAMENKGVSHCYLFQGEKGLGKRDMALAFSKTLLCRTGEQEPCDNCGSCIKFDGKNHPDFKILSPEKGIIKKTEIEKMINSMNTSPFEGKKKIFVIEECHMMRGESQNALLKTLEEPPEYVNIILTSSNPGSLLPTILSRCQIIKFYPIGQKKIIEHLIKDGVDEEKVNFISGFAKGSLNKAIELCESKDFIEKREEVLKIIDEILSGNKVKALMSLDFFNENKEEIDEILDIILYWFRDLLVYKEIGDTSILVNRDKIQILIRQSSMDLREINDIIYRVEATKINIKRNVNFNLAIETMLLNMGG